MFGRRIRHWFAASLTRKFVALVIGASATLCLVILVLLVSLYRAEIERERREASLNVNRLLEASLENAMLKRDLDGLREIVRRLGTQDGIRGVMIVNPENEVRFASATDLLGRTFAPGMAPTCSGCHDGHGPTGGQTAFMINERGDEVLRSVIPVRNKAQCVVCHGTLQESPINGVLFVDYDAGKIREKARDSALLLASSGALVALLTIGASFWFIRGFVLRPVRRLAGASRALAAGRLDSRAAVAGEDELGRLGEIFDMMAERLQQSHEKIQAHDLFLQNLIDAVPDGIRLIDADFEILNTNRAYCTQLGLEPGAANGIKCFSSSHARNEPCPPTLMTCPVHEIMRTGQPLKTLQQHVRADGALIQVEVVAAPVTLRVDGEDKAVIVESVRDLTQQVQFSQEQRLAEMDQLASGVAHEIRNPLASIRLALQAALRAHDGGAVEGEAIYGYLSTIDGEIDKCIQIAERLLKLSSPPDEPHVLVELNGIITDTLSLLSFEAAQAGITVALELDPGNPRVLASDSEMRMLVLNLVQNAFHAMPHGGRLDIATEQTAEKVSFLVEDTGVGIRPEDYPYVFDPFFSRRADGVRGTGLGLTICKSIVARHGGCIHLKTRLGSGTRFRIDLPAAGSWEAAVREDHEAQHPAH